LKPNPGVKFIEEAVFQSQTVASIVNNVRSLDHPIKNVYLETSRNNIKRLQQTVKALGYGVIIDINDADATEDVLCAARVIGTRRHHLHFNENV
jgi:hypothetical protein